MQTQNPVKLSNRLRQFARTVRAGNDAFGLRAAEMRTPVGYDSVSALCERSRLTAVPNDRMVGRLDCLFVQNFEIQCAWRKVADTVRESAIVYFPQCCFWNLAFHRGSKVDRK